MNIDIIEPINRIHLSSNGKITAIYYLNGRLFVGFSNGDLSIYSTTITEDNDDKLKFETSFHNVTRDSSSIDKISHLPVSNENTNKLILIISTIELYRIYEIIGSHVNLIQELEVGVDFIYGNYQENRLFITGSKKKVIIYKIINKTRNILQFQKFKEISVKDKIKSITQYNNTSILIGLTNDFLLLEYSKEENNKNKNKNDNDNDNDNQINFHIKPLIIDGFGGNSSFSYFGLSGSTRSWNIPIDNNEILLVKDSQSILLNNDKIIPSTIKWNSNVPTHITFISPIYLLIIYNKKLEIIDYTTGDLIQKFHHQINSVVQLTLENNIIFLSSSTEILQFKIIDYQKQIDQYLTITGKGSNSGNLKDPQNDLKIVGLNKAIKLVTKLRDTSKFFRSDNPEKQRLLILRKLYKRKAVVLFESYFKYHEALEEICSEWMISFRDVLALFPDFLNGEKFLSKRNEDEASSMRSFSTNVVKRVSIQDISILVNEQSGTESPAPSIRTNTTSNHGNINGPSQSKAQITASNIRKFSKAVKYLIVYLTDQRRINMSFLNDMTIKWKGIELTPYDLYIGKGNMKLYLNQVGKIIDTSLFLCYFYTKPMLLGPLLRLPNNFCDAKVVNDCLLSTNQIRELLDFYYSRHLHDSALEMLYKLSHEGDHSPDLTIEYLTKLNNDDLELIFQFAYWVITEELDFDNQILKSQLIFMNDSYECESYDNSKVLNFFLEVLKSELLGINYLEWLIFKSEKAKILDKFYTKLILLYIDQLKAIPVKNGEDETIVNHEVYGKLYKFLQTTDNYDPWVVLKQIPFERVEFLRFVVFIYKKLGEHEKSIDVLFNQLNDLDKAMEYCCEIYAINKITGQGLLQKLLEDLLINYDENIDLIEKLLNSQGSKMSILMVMTSLPSRFPLHKLSSFLNNQVINSQKNTYDTRVVSQLYKVGSLKLYDKILNIESKGYVINSGKQLCTICNKRLGYSVFTVDKNDHIVHYGCATNKKW
ncbi:vacuolar carboxypeptidase Y [Scheffersomyces amazonensis]|uniref:vacuolar carboxypeptidase Y n=1 Tax=Scheffersomyces amazonensis TaxID=1078765 RepID=UPI00315C5D4C